ncbi:MAG: 4-hydroxy-tetrahydrodipicolinate synthase [Nitrospirae bacterium]|nr:4-hydroxy-tetrahydrodipicolinate synthase [Nitrospirota bacterium]MDA1305065.1 4-hydroxy-tetrahydrodipicolinate synthase [Nitrospirota bacterium]
MFSGSHIAIITPFKNGKFDEQSYANLIEWQIANGTHGIVPCGTTGESATLTHTEHDRVVAFTVEVVNRRVSVIAGTGSNATAEAITRTKHAKQAGADGALLITPYYNKPTQEGLYQHYKAVAEAVDLPLILYNIEGRTSVNMKPDTIARTAKLSNVVGIKEGSGSLGQVSEIIHLCGPDFTILAGDDPLTLPMMALGAKGVITVTANVAPADMANMVNAALAGDFAKARTYHFKLAPLFKALFYETNPIPVKEAVAMMNKIDPELRLPLTPLSSENRERLRQVMKDSGLI